jgi:hypothetical protein
MTAKVSISAPMLYHWPALSRAYNHESAVSLDLQTANWTARVIAAPW